jgi:hypothetical protein
MKPELGDRFIIDYKNLKKIYPSSRFFDCKLPNMIFTICGFSKSNLSVYYNDNRTNKKCSCNRCSDEKQLKSVGVTSIIIIQKRISFERDRKLKALGIKNEKQE